MNERLIRRGQIVGLYQCGVGIAQIADQVGVSRSNVQRWVGRFEAGDPLTDRARPGRPRITTLDEDLEIVNRALINPLTKRGAAGCLDEVDCCVATVRRRLREAGLSSRRPAEKLFLTDEHKEERLRFSVAHMDIPQAYWDLTIFSDEKTFRSDVNGRMMLWRPRNTRFEADHLLRNRSSGHVCANFWGAMSAAGVGPIVPAPGRLNAAGYVEILDNHLVPYATTLVPPDEAVYFVQDHAPIHDARIVQDWFDEHPHIIKINWPRKFADGNPIENLWGHLVLQWENEAERNIEQLQAHVFAVWNALRYRPDVCQRLVESLPTRLREVVAANGDMTRF